MNRFYLSAILSISLLISSCFTQKATYTAIKEEGPILKIESPSYQLRKTPVYYVTPVLVAAGGYFYGSQTQIKQSDGTSKKGGALVGVLSAALAYAITGQFQNAFAPKPKDPMINPQFYLSKLYQTESRFKKNPFLQADNSNLYLFNRSLPVLNNEQVLYLKNLNNPAIIDEVIGASLNQDKWILETLLTNFPGTIHKKELIKSWTRKASRFSEIMNFRTKYPGFDEIFEPTAYTMVENLQEAGEYLGAFPQTTKRDELETRMLPKIQVKSDADAFISLFPASKKIHREGKWVKIGTVMGNNIEGYGAVLYGSEEAYIGTFTNNKLSGQGYMFINADVYTGNFRNGNLNGNGTATFNNGDTYKGEFKEDLFSGYGEFTRTDGSWHKGQFRNGERHGQGEARSVEGYRFVGNFVKDLPDGRFKVSKWTLMGMIADEWVVDFENGKMVGQNQTKSDLTDFVSGKAANEARIQRRQEKKEKCDKCDVDGSRTTYPSEESFLLVTQDKPGKIYMKSGDEYEYYYSNDRTSWLVATPLFQWDKKFKRFEDMLNYFIDKCKDKYCD